MATSKNKTKQKVKTSSKKSKPISKQANLKKKKIRLKILKWTSLFILIIGAIIAFLLSDLFNIKQIKVTQNNKISEQEIINLSGLKTNGNMFKYLTLDVKEKIKTNPYIEDVKIHRKLDGTIEINVKERVPTYTLLLENGQYAYINNQGYILEINQEKLQLPTITGYITQNIEPGNRLEVEDLQKLNTVIQIMNAAKEKNLTEKITDINIEDDTNFLITMESENKLIHFGDNSNINEKFVKLMAVLEDTVGQTGEIFVKNINKIYFRKEV